MKAYKWTEGRSQKVICESNEMESFVCYQTDWLIAGYVYKWILFIEYMYIMFISLQHMI